MSKSFIPENDHLTQEQLSRYLQDDMTREETRLIDTHLEECALCSDAVEGAMTVQSADFEQVIASVDEKLSRQYFDVPTATVLRPVRQFSIARWAAAAALAAVAGIGLWWLNGAKDDQVAPSVALEAPPQYQSAPNAIEPSNAPSVATLSPTTASVDAKKNIDNQLVTTESVAKKESKSPTANKGIKKQNKISVQTNAAIAATTPALSAAKVEARRVDPFTKSSVPTYRASTGASLLDNGSIGNNAGISAFDLMPPTHSIEYNFRISSSSVPNSYNSNVSSTSSPDNFGFDFDQNIVLERIIQRHFEERGGLNTPFHSTDSLLYRTALDHFKRGKHLLSAQEFEMVAARQKKGNLYEQSLWYAANAYLQTQNKAEAKALFERIVTEGGNFKSAASEILSKEF